MSEIRREPTVTMFIATPVLRQRRTRIAEIGGLTLPRTVEATTLFGTAGGAAFGLLVGLLLGGGVAGAMWATAIFGGLSYFLITFEPMRGHSLWRYLMLRRKSEKGRRTLYRGEPARVSIGVSRVDRAPRGLTVIRTGSVEVNPRNLDPERFRR